MLPSRAQLKGWEWGGWGWSAGSVVLGKEEEGHAGRQTRSPQTQVHRQALLLPGK